MNAEVRIEKTAYHGWPNCYRVSNGEIELIVTSDIGPRIMRLGFPGGQNFFWEEPAGVGKSGEPAWMKRGGHRVWVGPEDLKYTYPPDNSPIAVKVQGNVLIATEPVEKETGIEKQIEIRMDATGTGVTVIHRLRNAGIMPLEYAPWALTMMAQGGTAITGFPPRGTHEEYLQPTNPVVMWAYTDFSDPRWKFTTKYVTLRQDPSNANAQKLGTFNPKTWVAYALNGELFIKRTTARSRENVSGFPVQLRDVHEQRIPGDRNARANHQGAGRRGAGTHGALEPAQERASGLDQRRRDRPRRAPAGRQLSLRPRWKET